MFIGHIPAGYISSRAALRVLPRHHRADRIHLKFFVFWGILGSIFPDLDMFYFYLIDNRQHLHHGYWTHLPFYWLWILLPIFVILSAFRKTVWRLYLAVFSINIFIHLFLDTIVGKIRWLYPFSAQDFFFFHVPARYNWWIWNFVFHWTFLFEIALTLIAVFLFIGNIAKTQQNPLDRQRRYLSVKWAFHRCICRFSTRRPE